MLWLNKLFDTIALDIIDPFGYIFAIVFMFTSIAIFVSYTKLNATIKELENLKNG